MADLDEIPKRLQGLQLLVDQFHDAEEANDRDDVLADIIGHDSPEAVEFLRLLARDEDDPYTKCDAICGLALRTGGKEGVGALLDYLATTEAAYEYCRAAETLGDLASTEASSHAIDALWRAWEKPLKSEQVNHTLFALEKLAPVAAAERLCAWLLAQEQPGDIPFERAELVLKALVDLDAGASRAPLTTYESKLRALAKQYPDDAVDLEELADAVTETLKLFDEPGESDDSQEEGRCLEG